MSDSSTNVVFPAVGGQAVTGRFDGGAVTSDAGLLLVAQADRKLRLTEKLSEQILDRREPGKVVHPIEELLRERLYAIAQGSREAAGDTNDMDTLGSDPALVLACGKRLDEPLGSQPTLSRFENGVELTREEFPLCG